jgi:SAM-dependent methyltransferase
MTDSAAVQPGAFRAFEHAGWQRAASRYDEVFRQITSQTIETLLDAVEVTRGARLLDVATGPGYVARRAADRGARVLGVDFSLEMVARARHNFPGLEFCEGDAAALPFADASFDAVCMNYGLLHLAEPERALTEARRVLCTGGRFGFSVWAAPEEAVGLGLALNALRTHGDLAVSLPPGPPFFRFSDADECMRALAAAGFERARVTKVPQTWRLPSADALFDALCHATVRTAGLLRAQAPGALAQVRAAILQSAERYRDEAGLALPMPGIVASATKA